ncbi:MAG: hypothetical protein RH917_07860 [Lacipirellulaceae bacterium]
MRKLTQEEQQELTWLNQVFRGVAHRRTTHWLTQYGLEDDAWQDVMLLVGEHMIAGKYRKGANENETAAYLAGCIRLQSTTFRRRRVAGNVGISSADPEAGVRLDKGTVCQPMDNWAEEYRDWLWDRLWKEASTLPEEKQFILDTLAELIAEGYWRPDQQSSERTLAFEELGKRYADKFNKPLERRAGHKAYIRTRDSLRRKVFGTTTGLQGRQPLERGQPRKNRRRG